MIIQIDDKRKAILDCNSQMIVLGGPGSGKTTIALIKANKEISSLAKNQKVLFLSFARATVARVQESAAQSISNENLKRISVNTYHGFFWNILKSHGYLISAIAPLKIINPADAAVKMSHLKSEQRRKEFERIFNDEGIIGFDLFAVKVKELFTKSKKIREIFSRSFPTIVVDEFQDTNKEEWEVIKLLGQNSRIIALADADQRIYEFRGADPARIGQFLTHFNPQSFDFENENNRSNGTDISVFGNDLLTGANLSKTYSNVYVVGCPFYRNHHEMYLLKTNILSALGRLKNQGEWSVAVLVPTKKQMLLASNYLSSEKDNLPVLNHDVAIDAEGPTLAGALFASLLEKHDNVDLLTVNVATKVINYIKGKNGSKPPAQTDLAIANGIAKYLQTRKRKPKIFKEIETVVSGRVAMALTGNPLEDWMNCVKLFSDIVKQKNLVNLQEDARYVRLLHKGSQLREALSIAWRANRFYKGAEALYLNAIQQENFSTTVKAFSGIHVMTIHKSKGKEFDEVFIYEGYRQGRIVRDPNDPGLVAQARLTLRVGVTRAQKRTTILTPTGNRCELLR